MKTKGLLPIILILPGINLLYSCLLVPLYRVFLSDAVLAASLWLDLIDILIQWTEIFGISLAFAFLLLSFFRKGISGSLNTVIIVVCSLFLKYFSSVVALSILKLNFDLTENYFGYILSFLIEIAECAVVLFFGSYQMKKEKFITDENRRAAQRLSIPFAEPSPLLPAGRYFDFRGIPQKTALLGMILVVSVRSVAYLISEIAYSKIGYGFSVSDLPIVLLYWLIPIILPGIAAYFLIISVLRHSKGNSNPAWSPAQ